MAEFDPEDFESGDDIEFSYESGGTGTIQTRRATVDGVGGDRVLWVTTDTDSTVNVWDDGRVILSPEGGQFGNRTLGVLVAPPEVRR